MSMPSRSRSRMAASVLQAGPMVQMIFARRGEGLGAEGAEIDSGWLILNLPPQSDSLRRSLLRVGLRRFERRERDVPSPKSLRVRHLGAVDCRQLFSQHGAGK